MNYRLAHVLATCVILISPAVQAQDSVNAELEALRQEVLQMRTDYESRISDLEARLAAAEKTAAEANATAEIAQETASEAASSTAGYGSPQTVSVARDNAFNPAIGVVFQGQAWAYDQDPEDYQIPGFPTGGEAGLAAEGLSLAETEISMSANVDDKFTAMLTVPIAIEDGEVHVELEEAWVETLALPAGFSLKMGRFFSDVGYLNDKHFHSWDFADQPLVYNAFLGGQYLDDGLQLRWLAPTDFYLELSGEVLRGGRYPAGGAARSGLGSTTLAVKTGGDVGFSSSWLFGLSWLNAEAADRESGSEDSPLLFTGDSDIYIADFVWKWAPNGNSKERNFKFQAEYMWRDENGIYDVPDAYTGPWDESQQGWYAQAIFQPFPRWRFGARFDRLSADQPPAYWIDTPLYPLGSNPTRYSLMVDWSNSEFSRLRFQYNYDKASLEDDNQFGLQYIFSIGAHGAHGF
jgi:hypothetical protein